jgi:hypothetical protein
MTSNKIPEKQKNFFNTLIELIFKNAKMFFSWIVLLISLLLLKNKISISLAELSIITDKEVESKYFDFAYIALIVIVAIRYLWLGLKNYIISKKQNFIISLMTILYLTLRNDKTDSLRFSNFKFDYDYYYLDIILLFSGLSFLLFLRNVLFSNIIFYDKVIICLQSYFVQQEKENTYTLIQDTPLDGSLTNDNEIIILEIESEIKKLESLNSFIIGINSIWGTGKTSFLKRLEFKLKKSDDKVNTPIIFWFNAWQHQDEKSIINNFFNQLKKELSVFSGDSKNSIDNYLKQLLALVDNKVFIFFKSLTDNIFSDGETIKDYYDDINAIIERIDRKIIVFVDDIDRLNKTEILETLRVLRNIANFKNVVFICGFDREYVIKQSQIDSLFLDKIFNLEINLTTQNPRSFVVYLIELISNSSGLNTEEKELLNKSINEFFNADEDTFFIDFIANKQLPVPDSVELKIVDLIPSFFFESRRDVKKFYNELYFNIKVLKKTTDIELEDYLILKLLLFKYKWMYKNFAAKRIFFWLGNEDALKFKDNKLENLLINSEIEIQDKYIIFSILKRLFPEFSSNENSKKINMKRYFPIYFNNNVFNESFSYTDLLEALGSMEIEKLLIDRVIGKENENLVKDDIKSFILKPENIRNIEEYKQVISLIKKDYFSLVTENELAQFMYLGENNFTAEYKNLIGDKIFTNFSDPFGLFLFELNTFYSRFPKDTSLNNGNDIYGFFYKNRIKEYEILNPSKSKELILNNLNIYLNSTEVEIVKVFSAITITKEYYYPIFNFELPYIEAKEIIINFITNNFSTIFLKNTAYETLIKLDIRYVAFIFEDIEKRTSIITQAEFLLNERKQWSDTDLNVKDYIIKGWDNFIKYMESSKAKITEEELIIYNDLISHLNVFKKTNYSQKPNLQAVDNFLKENSSDSV